MTSSSDIDALRSGFAKLAPFEYDGALAVPRWSFTGGFPDPRHFPTAELKTCSERASADGHRILEYGSGIDETLRYGEASLRRSLVSVLGADLGPAGDISNVMLTNGAIDAIQLAFRAFLDPGDVVVIEAPTWPVALTLSRLHGADLIAIEVDESGLSVDQLEESLAQLAMEGRRLKLLYTIPTFQTPTGTVLAVDRRRRLAELSAEFGFIIVEDGTYEALRYEGEAEPSIQSFDTSGTVLKVGSFSKTVAPALRIGWAAGATDTLATLASVRTDLGVNHWSARTLALFLDGGGYAAHLERLISSYRDKRNVVHDALTVECSGSATWSPPEGGYFFWLRLTDQVDSDLAVGIAQKKGIAIRPGEQFFGLPDDGKQYLRIAFSQVPIELIREGVAELGKALRTATIG